MSATHAGGDETANDILSVAPVAASRRDAPSAWEDGTPLRPRCAQAKGFTLEPVTDLGDVDVADLVGAPAPSVAPLPHDQDAPAAGTRPRRSAPPVHLPGRTLAVAAAALVLALLVWRVGTLVLPPLVALAALVGLALRRSRSGGAR